MKPVKTIAAVGVSAELLEELKAAIAATAPRLDSDWQWASEQNPDLLVVDPGDFAARMARTRAQVTGVRYVVVGDAAKHATDRFVLLRPYRKDAVAAVLNAAGSATVSTSPFASQADSSFYDIDLDGSEGGSAGLDLDVPDTRVPHRSPDAAQGLDEMIRGDPLAPAPDPAMRRIPADATVAPPGQETARSAARRDQTLDRMRRAGHGDSAVPGASTAPMVPGLSMPTATPPMPLPDDAGGQLAQYLAEGALGGPTRIQTEGAPALVLDPKPRLFHAEGDLTALEPYCTRTLPRRELHAVSSSELAQVRSRAPGRPYQDLLWLQAMLAGDGRLAQHLDPGGSFRVTRTVAIDPAFRQHGAIAAALQSPARLHEIAAAASAPMERVFDVVNAYESVGLLQWTPRPPRHAPESEAHGAGGLFARLRQRLRR